MGQASEIYENRVGRMKDFTEYVRKIEDTRIQLNKLIVEKSFNLQDREVLSVSRQLDKLVLKCQKSKILLNNESILPIKL